MVGLENADSPQEVLYVHQALLDEQCHPLCDALREFWKVFDFETVQRFALFLYDGDYSYPTPAPMGVVTPARSGSNKPERLLESGTFSLSPQSGANSTTSTTPGAGGPAIGGSSTLFDAARASTVPENAPVTVARLGQLLRYGAFSGRTGGLNFGFGGPLTMVSLEEMSLLDPRNQHPRPPRRRRGQLEGCPRLPVWASLAPLRIQRKRRRSPLPPSIH